MDVGDMATRKGSFSFKQDDISWVQLDANHRVHIERLDVNTARVYVVNLQMVQVPLLPLNVTMRNSGGQQLPILANNFIIAWADSYELMFNGMVHMKLEQQKQQAIRAAADVASGQIDA